MALVQTPRIKLEKTPEQTIKNIQIALERFRQDFDNAVGNAINPYTSDSPNSGPSSGGNGGSALDIDTAPVINSLTSGVATNAVNKTVEGYIDVDYTPSPNTVGTEIYYRESGTENYRESYATHSPYRLLHLLPGVTYDIRLSGQAANGHIGPFSPTETATISSEKANIAPADAHYIVTQMHEDLSNEHILQVESNVVSKTVTTNDITIGIEPSGISTPKLANLAVTTPKIADDVVDNTKLANMAGLSVKARPTNAIDDPTDLVATANDTVLARISNTLQWVPLDGSQIPIPPPANNTVGTNQIQDLAVTNPKIGPLAVTTDKITDLSITTLKLANSSVTLGKLAVTGTALSLTHINSAGTNIETVPTALLANDTTLTLGTRHIFGDKVGIGTVTPETVTQHTITAPLNISTVAMVQNANQTANQGTVTQFIRRTSADMVDGFGVMQLFIIGDNALTDNTIGQLGFKRESADNSGRWFVRTYNAGVVGSLTTPGTLAVDHFGNVSLNVDVSTNGGQGVLAFAPSTAPSSTPTGVTQLWNGPRTGGSINGLNVITGNSSRHVFADLVGILTDAPTVGLDVNAGRIRLRNAVTIASATAVGDTGSICWDANYVYVCIATNTWRRIPHATW